MGTNDSQAALDEAIARSARFGWRVVRRKRNSAELTDASGSQRLFLEVGPDGTVRDRHMVSDFDFSTVPQRVARPQPQERIARPEPRREVHPLPSARILPARILPAALSVLLGVLVGIALTLVPGLRSHVGLASSMSLTQENVEYALVRDAKTVPGANFQNMRVAVNDGTVDVAVQPNLSSDLDALTVASADTFVAGRSVFHSFPDARLLTVSVFGTLGVTPGQQPIQLLALIRLSSTTAARTDFSALEPQVPASNTLLFCSADRYRVASLIYLQFSQELQNTGCLTGPMR